MLYSATKCLQFSRKPSILGGSDLHSEGGREMTKEGVDQVEEGKKDGRKKGKVRAGKTKHLSERGKREESENK